MTDEEIKKIAYYISEKRHKEEEVSDGTTFIFPIDIYADIVSKLSERYFIVPKDKVEKIAERCESISTLGEQMCSDAFIALMQSNKKLIEYLFDVKIVKEEKE